MNVDNTPFIMDVITSDKIYLIDFSCRIGGNELTHLIFSDWGLSVVDSILSGSDLEYIAPKKHYIFQSLPFKTGSILGYDIDTSYTFRYCPPNGNIFHGAKNVDNVLSRGYVIVNGNNFAEASSKLKYTLETFSVRYSDSE
jgi:hypothetical protein